MHGPLFLPRHTRKLEMERKLSIAVQITPFAFCLFANEVTYIARREDEETSKQWAWAVWEGNGSIYSLKISHKNDPVLILTFCAALTLLPECVEDERTKRHMSNANVMRNVIWFRSKHT